MAGVCVACPPGTTNDAGDATTDGESQCDATLCEENEYVIDHLCESCPPTLFNEPGDDASGANTRCTDHCEQPLGVLCGEAWRQLDGEPEFGDDVGWVVAAAGDRIAVGAPRDNNDSDEINGTVVGSAIDSGAVYVFTRSDAEWLQEAYIKAPNSDAGDGFGKSLAFDGDTLVVGAPGEASALTGIDPSLNNNDASSSGAVYVFVRNDTTWTRQAYIKASNAEQNDEFGTSVAIDGDLLVVGAIGEASQDGTPDNNAVQGSGAAYVFERSGSAWGEVAYLKSGFPQVNDVFGRSVAVEAETIAVGATGEDSSATGIDGDEMFDRATNSGAVFVFRRSGAIWQREAYIKAPVSFAEIAFGGSVALSGDRLAVGAANEHGSSTGVGGDPMQVGATRSGAVFTYTRNGTTWAPEAYIKAHNTGARDGFGAAIDLGGDQLVVGAPFEDARPVVLVNGDDNDNLEDSGAVYLFQLGSSGWAQRTYYKLSQLPMARFGNSVSLSSEAIAVGAPATTAPGPWGLPYALLY